MRKLKILQMIISKLSLNTCMKRTDFAVRLADDSSLPLPQNLITFEYSMKFCHYFSPTHLNTDSFENDLAV